MHTLEIYKDLKTFYEDVYEILRRDEIKNLIMLGNLLIGIEGTDRTGWRNVDNWFMAAVRDKDKIVLTALMTPPMNLTLYETIADEESLAPNGEALSVLAEGLLCRDIPVPGVMAENELALRFARIFKEKSGLSWKIDRNQRIYALTEVNRTFLEGENEKYTLRPVKPQDMSFLPFWVNGFNEECHSDNSDVIRASETAEHYIQAKRLYILEDNGTAVTMAGSHRNMQRVGGVGPVYTPPYFRNRGYASVCVAKLSQQILDSGKMYCVLYTDLANPISNSIYQRIGYRMVCDSMVIRFEA